MDYQHTTTVPQPREQAQEQERWITVEVTVPVRLYGTSRTADDARQRIEDDARLAFPWVGKARMQTFAVITRNPE